MLKKLPLLKKPDGDTWVLKANRKPPTTVVLPDSVLAGLLSCLAAHPEGATMARCQAAVQRVVTGLNRTGKHPVLTLMRWAAPNRGIEFVCANGVVTCTLPDAMGERVEHSTLAPSGDPLEDEPLSGSKRIVRREIRHSERVAAITDMLLRIPIQRAQRVMYKFVLDTKDHSFLRSLAEKTLEFDRKQFQGVLSALTLRINNTAGLLAHLRPGWSFVFSSTTRDADEVFSARPELLEALRVIPELSKYLAADLETVRDGPEFSLGPGDSFDADELALGEDLDELRADPAIAATDRAQLVRARVGQGLFRERVARSERSCRVTGVTDLRHLRASHIKPWRLSTNEERLDGANGLLLSPHVDHLFDRGFISFEEDGTLLLSPQLDPTVLHSWAIDVKRKGRRFTKVQNRYLAHHRIESFLKK
jgi:hypothetical protein